MKLTLTSIKNHPQPRLTRGKRVIPSVVGFRSKRRDVIGAVGSLAARIVLFIMRSKEDGASNASREQKHQHQHGQINEGPYGHTPRIRRPHGWAKWAGVFMRELQFWEVVGFAARYAVLRHVYEEIQSCSRLRTSSWTVLGAIHSSFTLFFPSDSSYKSGNLCLADILIGSDRIRIGSGRA